jgi:pimeloyl-ACP methyl ester carboxylesterase
VEFLRAHLRKERIILLGHSWGSMLGLRMIAQRPDLFLAYVGTGQNVNVERGQEEIGYPQILAKARTLGNRRAVSALERVGPPPYRILSQYYVPIGWENRLDARRPPFSIAGFGNFMSDVLLRPYLRNGAEFSQALMLPAMLNEDAFAIATHFDVPVIFIQGETDIITPTALARDYFDRIEAPKKEFVLLPDTGHLAIFSARDVFFKELTARVRPLALERH